MGSTDARMALEQRDADDRETRNYVGPMLAPRGVPERVNYAAGVLLDTTDFEGEQAYHRGRLGRVLAALFGFGTLAGLRVSCVVDQNPQLEVQVAPGLALDRLGRLVEVRATQCLKVADWLAAIAATSDAGSRDRDEVVSAIADGTDGKVLRLNVWLKYVACYGPGRTPAFAAGPFNATDYNVPARLVDAFDITLALAAGDDGRLPANARPTLDRQVADLQALTDAQRTELLVGAVLDGWVQPPKESPDRLAMLNEHREEADWNSIFLARVVVPVAAASGTDAFPVIDAARLAAGPADLADNSARPVVYVPTAWRGRAD